MAIADLLWACPACGEDRGLSRDDGRCRACGTTFTRAAGATIRATRPDGTTREAGAGEWLAKLPDPATLLERDPVRTARVQIRPVTGLQKVFGETGYLNRVEVFGDRVPGTLRLEADRLVVARDGGDGGGGGDMGDMGDMGDGEVWPLEGLTAVQASSSSLQLKRRGEPLVAFYFDDDAIYLWEQLLRAALRDLYGRRGWGEVVEFQPRIEVRPPEWARTGSGGSESGGSGK